MEGQGFEYVRLVVHSIDKVREDSDILPSAARKAQPQITRVHSKKKKTSRASSSERQAQFLEPTPAYEFCKTPLP